MQGLIVALLIAAACSAAVAKPNQPIRFGRDVLPILSANCFTCHGPDDRNRKAGLRLDIETDAKAKRRSGYTILEGQADKSLLIQRISSRDPAEIMPPPASHKQLSPDQVETLRQWVSEGAKWGKHWSFEPLVRPVAANGNGAGIDYFVASALGAKGLVMQRQASPQSLVRRLWLDLTGLPPTPETADKFAASPTRAAYEAMVDELLSKPQFGEHWARMWLDLARYADTKGYEKDRGRTVWPYRDWVIRAFNSDMPLDRFTIEQLAGDLLPNPTIDQLTATTFHRITMANDEGGTDDEEFRVAAVKDRIDTTVQVWMGLTMGCAKCHSHKYEPIPHAEYYGFYGLFNQTEDSDRYDDAPTMEILTQAEKKERADLRAKISSLTDYLKGLEEKETAGNLQEEAKWEAIKVVEAKSAEGAQLKVQDDSSITVSGRNAEEDTFSVTVELAPGIYNSLRLEILPEKLGSGELAVSRAGTKGDVVLSELKVMRGGVELHFNNPRADHEGPKGGIAAALDGDEKTGWSILPRTHERHVAILDFRHQLMISDRNRLSISMVQMAGTSLTARRFRFAVSKSDPATLLPRQPEVELLKKRDELAAAYEAERDFNDQIVRLPIMRELPSDKQRVTRIHRRGNFLDQGDEVKPGVLSAFGKLPDGAPNNRLGVAKWLVSPANPLTPRVWANRIWSRLFGVGLVETEEDFGALGSLPSNPDLLDWLASEYRDNGWSLKKLLKTIVMSKAYQQASVSTPISREADPRNLIQSRGARYRLSAEAVRDQALSIGGLLSLKIGGPSVMPPQPAGLWRSTYSGKSWVDAEGEDRVRRGIYTYLKRTTPYPAMTTFDAGSGEVCQIRRIRTNTPLQALITMNDPVYMEAAAGLAGRMTAVPGTASAKAARGLRLALVRPLTAGEQLPLVILQREAEAGMTEQKAQELIKVSRGRVPAGMSIKTFASWIVVANAILNLDEVLTRN